MEDLIAEKLSGVGTWQGWSVRGGGQKTVGGESRLTTSRRSRVTLNHAAAESLSENDDDCTGQQREFLCEKDTDTGCYRALQRDNVGSRDRVV